MGLRGREIPSDAARSRRLGWKRLGIISFVKTVTLGSLGLFSALPTLGIIADVVLKIGVYAGYIIGHVKLKLSVET